ncbi:dihydroorotate dehydrogenase [Ruminococcaceae bacterium OttesenSCG-928-I18]|nr:dihydroorotate dehydrogenase [Ruminococcaceae bacterium OttesenSCG-928-I18]
MDLTTTLCGIELPNPVMPASGTFGFGYDMARWYELDCLGALCIKGATKEARYGNPQPRIAECEGGLLNAIGLQNPGVEAIISEELPRLRNFYKGPVIANISGFSTEEYVYVAEKFDEDPNTALLELNISCPNVHGGGMAFGTDATCAAGVVSAVKKAVKKPVLVKLSPNVSDIVAIALACESAGADGLVLINTLLGMRIDPRRGKPIVSTGASGFSGPAIKPVALRMVYEVCSKVHIPVVGVGGIADPDDVLEFLAAGAVAVQVGSQNLVDPFACKNIIETLPLLLQAYGLGSVKSAIGRAQDA